MRCAVVGTSFISQWFVEAAQKVEGAEVYAVCSRSALRGKAFADKNGIPLVYESLTQALEDPMVELVYVASPNSVHYGQVKEALAAGRHVICEKPFFTGMAEFEEIRRMVQSSEAYLFEAITTPYLPNYRIAREALEELGPIHLVNINYSQYSSRFDQLKAGEMTNVFDPAMGGGSLPDLGIYCIHLAVSLFGAPQEVVARSVEGYGADLADALILTYPGMLCTITTSKACGGPAGASIQGERGWLEVTDSPGVCAKVFLHKNGETKQLSTLEHRVDDRMVYEVEAFFKAIEAGDRAMMLEALEHSGRVLTVLDQAKASARRG